MYIQDFQFYHHRANIISLIMEKSQQLYTSTQLVSQHDDVSVTIFLCERILKCRLYYYYCCVVSSHASQYWSNLISRLLIVIRTVNDTLIALLDMLNILSIP